MRFDAFVEKHKIEDSAVCELAKIVRTADTDKTDAREAAGLDAIMTGISIAAKDDYEAVEKTRPVYDALYTFCRLKFLREKYRARIEKMDRKTGREFLASKLQKLS